MATLKEELNQANEEAIVKPTISKNITHPTGESIVLFDYCKRYGKVYRIFYGVGVVCRIVKGSRFDMVYVNFGVFANQQTRVVVVQKNHARRQIMTLKKGQICQVYGICRNYKTDFELNNGEKKYRIRLGLYATALQGWYVPTMLDIKKMPNNDDLVNPSEKEQDLIETFEDVLDDFLNGTGDDEDEIERD